MAELTDTLWNWGSVLGVWTTYILIGLAIIIILGGIGIYAARRKKWNLRVEIKMPRSDGLIINSEKAKGHLDVKGGVVSIKRKGIAASEMKPFEIREYLQGVNYLEVMQVGPDDFIPVSPTSYTIIKDDKTKEKYSLLSIKGDLGSRRQWAFHAAKNAKNRFTLAGLLDKYQFAIQISIILFAMFVGFAALWSKVG